MRKNLCLLLIGLTGLTACNYPERNEWISLFNGKDLNDWTPKFTGFELGENYLDTFQVSDGILQVSYDNWPTFNGEFGHLFYKTPFSRYRLLVEYRFVGEQVKDGPAWAIRNNGLMLHSQPPETMLVDQEFPASIEAQILGGNGQDERPTANVCSPGTNYVVDGVYYRPHCRNSTSKTLHGTQWVKLEIEVLGNESIKHWINDELVFDYSQPSLDPDDPDGARLISLGYPVALDSGYITIQAESHPTEFRRIDLLPLD